MKILKGVGDFVVITPKGELKRQLLVIEMAGRVCYQSLKGAISAESSAAFIRMLLKRGHESPLEHSAVTIKFVGCSRGFTHELVRHRLASYNQESTRYVDESDARFVVPPHRDENTPITLDDGREMSLSEILAEEERFYRALKQSGWPPEDARQVLPIATRAEIVVTANFREWRHIFEMRTQKAAHWEIRSVMCRLLIELKKLVPAVFDDFTLQGTDKNGVPFFAKGKS